MPELTIEKPTVLLVPPGAIAKEDKAALKDAGYLVIETKDPAAIKFINQLEIMTGDDMVDALLHSLTQGNSAPTYQGYVGTYLVKTLMERRKVRK